MVLSACDIINKYAGAGKIGEDMSVRPEFYAGYGIDKTYLNSKILEKLYRGVKAEIGDSAACAFVNMVNNLEVASAQNFLVSFYRLEQNGWVFDEWRTVSEVEGFAETVANAVRDNNFRGGLTSIANIVANDRGKATAEENLSVTGQFLGAHLDELDGEIIGLTGNVQDHRYSNFHVRSPK